MNELIRRLREGQYNSLQDILLEASDAFAGDEMPEAAEILKVCSNLISRVEQRVKAEADALQKETKEAEEESYAAGWNVCLTTVENNLPASK